MLSINNVSGYGNYQSSNIKQKQMAFGAYVDMKDIYKIAKASGNREGQFLDVFGILKPLIDGIMFNGQQVYIKIRPEESSNKFFVKAVSGGKCSPELSFTVDNGKGRRSGGSLARAFRYTIEDATLKIGQQY